MFFAKKTKDNALGTFLSKTQFKNDTFSLALLKLSQSREVNAFGVLM